MPEYDPRGGGGLHFTKTFEFSGWEGGSGLIGNFSQIFSYITLTPPLIVLIYQLDRIKVLFQQGIERPQRFRTSPIRARVAVAVLDFIFSVL